IVLAAARAVSAADRLIVSRIEVSSVELATVLARREPLTALSAFTAHERRHLVALRLRRRLRRLVTARRLALLDGARALELPQRAMMRVEEKEDAEPGLESHDGDQDDREEAGEESAATKKRTEDEGEDRQDDEETSSDHVREHALTFRVRQVFDVRLERFVGELARERPVAEEGRPRAEDH